MPKPAKKKHPGRRGDPVSLHPLSADQAISLMFQIKPDDVRKILAKRPGNGKKRA
jgi:hypothetical protein